MSDIVEDADALAKSAREVKARFEETRRAVLDWMDAEGAEGRLRFNDQAPGWAAYKEAEANYQRVSTALMNAAASG